MTDAILLALELLVREVLYELVAAFVDLVAG